MEGWRDGEASPSLHPSIPPSLPLIRRFPALGRLPRAALGSFPTPVERVERGASGPPLWAKRDDLSGDPLGGNKVRALEFLLAGAGPGDEVLTLGGRGSTHALATTLYAHRLGARATVIGWRQEMNADAAAVAARLAREADRRIAVRSPLEAYAVALALRVARRVRWVPAGGTSPLGMLGHVSAALELAEQIAAGALPPPATVVVPLGSGGTAAGLALGLAIAGLDAVVLGARVVPRLVANRTRVLALAARTAWLIRRVAGEPVPLPRPERLRVAHDWFGGAYGRTTAAGTAAADWLRGAAGIGLDATYSAKACAAALAERGVSPVLLWITFDGRWME